MGDSWQEYGKFVLEEIKRLNVNIEKLTDHHYRENKKIWVVVTTLKVKAGVWGLLGGILATIPTVVIFYLRSFK